MFWALLGIISAAIIYAVTVIREYKDFVQDVQPRIDQLEKQADNLERLVERESNKLRQAQAKLDEDKDLIMDMQREIVNVENRLKTTRDRERQLEMSLYKQEFRQNRKRY